MKLNKTSIIQAVSVLCLFAIIAISIVVQYGGLLLHGEGQVFLVNYWDNARSLAAIVMDPLNNDWGSYQARELSYFFDYLDARFIRIWIDWGIPHFFSLSTIICYLAIAVIFLLAGGKTFKNLSRGSLLAASSLPLVMPGIFWGLCYFRSSKPGCALALAVIAFCLYYFFHNFRDDGKEKSLCAVFILVPVMEFFMMMMDRQGMFFALVITIGLGLTLGMLAWRRQDAGAGRLIRLTLYSFGVIAFGAWYNYYLGPELIFGANGVFPGAGFQEMGMSSLLNFRGGLAFFMQNMGGMFGGLGSWAGYIFTILIGLGIAAPWFWRKSHLDAVRRSGYLLFAYVYLVAAMIGAANMMTARHPAMLQADVIRGGYFAPNMVIMIFFFLISLDSVSAIWRYRHKKILIFAVLSLLLLANICYLPEAKRRIENGHLSGPCQNAQVLLQILRRPEIDYQSLSLSVREYNFIAAARRDKKLEYVPGFRFRGFTSFFDSPGSAPRR